MPEITDWHSYRTHSKPQRVALEFVTNEGPFAKAPLAQPFCLYGGAGFGGKAGTLDSLVATPFGFRAMRDVKVGSLVCSHDGSVNRVIAVHPQGQVPAFRVEFRDGSSYECTEDHLWLCRRRTGKTKKPEDWRIRHTRDLKPGMAIPVAAPVVFTDAARYPRRPLPPYLVGVVIGDGCTMQSGITLTTKDPEIAERLRSLGVDLWPYGNLGIQWRISVKETGKVWEDLGLRRKKSPEKRIPPAYLLGSVEERWELLRGLMDTDGTADRAHGKISYSTSSEGLARDVVHLVASLGGVASVRRRATARLDSFTVQIALSKPWEAFSLDRKRRLANRNRPVERTVERVVPIGVRECQCITVDHPSGLYLGDGFVVTHNSYLLRSAAWYINFVLRSHGIKNPYGAIFCDTYPNLKDRHIGKFEDEFSGLATVSNSKDRGLVARFAGDGMGGVCLRNVHSDDQVGKSRRGSEYDYVLIDELTEFTRDQFDKIMYTARSGKRLPFFAFLAATNPDGVGHTWVKEIFHPKYRNLRDPFFTAISPSSILFVPARKSDNPAYEHMKEVVDHRLSMISDPDVRKARNEGSWELYASGRFGSVWNREKHVKTWEQFLDNAQRFGVPSRLSLNEFLRHAGDWGYLVYGSLDFATSVDSVSAYLQHVVGPDGRPTTVKALGMSGLQLEAQAARILELEKGIQVEARFADPTIAGKAAEREDQKTRLERFADAGVDFLLGVNDRVEGWSTLASLLYFDKENPASEPAWTILEDCHELIRELPGLPRDKHNPEDVDRMGGIWHWSDSARYFLHTRFQGGMVPVERPLYGSYGYYRQILRDQTESRQVRRGLAASAWR